MYSFFFRNLEEPEAPTAIKLTKREYKVQLTAKTERENKEI